MTKLVRSGPEIRIRLFDAPEFFCSFPGDLVIISVDTGSLFRGQLSSPFRVAPHQNELEVGGRRFRGGLRLAALTSGAADSPDFFYGYPRRRMGAAIADWCLAERRLHLPDQEW